MDLTGKIKRWRKRQQEAKRWEVIKKAWPDLYQTPVPGAVTNHRYALGITTYLPRFETYLQPLIKQLYTLFPDTQIIVSINGYHDEPKQLEYLKQAHAFLDQYPNVEHFDFIAPEGLCKLWNGMILRSNAERIFILNDDIESSPDLRKELESNDLLSHEIAVLNGSWSHFMVSPAIIRQIGWFDERFPGIGYEDHDYEIRMTLAGKPIQRLPFESLNNLTHVPTDYSWGGDHRLIFGKYSGLNGDHYERKWDIRPDEAEGYTYVNIVQGWVRLRDDMETPDFHPAERATYT